MKFVLHLFLWLISFSAIGQSRIFFDLAINADNSTDMLYYINKHLENFPNDDYGYSVKANALMGLDSFNSAYGYYLLSIKMFNSNDNVSELGSRYLGAAFCLASLGLIDDACSYGEKALEYKCERASSFLTSYCYRRCEALTLDGNQCKRLAVRGQKFCSQHKR